MLTTLQVAGDARAIGLELGRFGAGAVHELLRPTPAWRQAAALADSDHVLAMAACCRRRYPRIWDEIEGLAAGLGVAVTEVFAWNCRGDLGIEAGDGCTTLMAASAQRGLIAHNEDGYPALADRCAILHACPSGQPAFTAFVYPGSLPGHTFAVNRAGLGFAVNNIHCLARHPGLPRQVMARAALVATSLDEALATLADRERAGAFHHVVAQAGDPRLLSLEATPLGSAVTWIERPCAHANHLTDTRLAHVPQRITASSAARQERAAQLADTMSGAPEMEAGLAFLRDQGNAALPILRQAADDPDAENTLASAVIETTPTAIRWRFYGRGHWHPGHQGSIIRATS